MGIDLDSPDTVIIFPPLESLPDEPEDKPTAGPLLEETIGPLHLPELVSGGAGEWSHFYNKEETLSSDVPLRTIRLALRYGIRAFDTAPYYGDSEIVLGTALKALELEFPRSSYQLITKVGRYRDGGASSSSFDYSPSTLRTSVRRSLRRLHTQYLDVVYLHDVEFVASCVAPRKAGNHAAALGAEEEAYGLLEPCEASVDDERVLEAIETLRSMQADGLILHIGISGLPLPALLRIAQLVLSRTGRPLDIVQSYAHLTLQNGTLPAFASALMRRARVSQVVAASPLGMGLLAPPPAPPEWHPALSAVRDAAGEAVRVVGEAQIAPVAVAWSVREAQQASERMPVVVGVRSLQEVHAAVEAWRWARDGDEGRKEELERKAALALGVFERTGTAGWTWASGNWA